MLMEPVQSDVEVVAHLFRVPVHSPSRGQQANSRVLLYYGNLRPQSSQHTAEYYPTMATYVLSPPSTLATSAFQVGS